MSRYPVVVDTNVPLTANMRAPQADLDCQVACLEKLIDIQNRGRVLVDASGFIFQEYSRNLSFKGQPGMGDIFFKWLWNNQGQPALCTKVPIEPEDEAGEMFPCLADAPELQHFDRSDRKFVAVALVSRENPAILNATDTDWWLFRDALEQFGIHVEQLCPQHVADRCAE